METCTYEHVCMYVHVCLRNIFAFFYLELSLSTSLHFLLRGSAQSPHVERSYDKVSRRKVGEGGRVGGGGGGGERERKRKKGGGSGGGGCKDVEDRGRLRIRLGVECDQGRRDRRQAIKGGGGGVILVQMGL